MSKWLVVGAGLAGSTFARLAAEAGHQVLVIDKRLHIAGNCCDAINQHGVRYHLYGPHIFHTNSENVWNFLSRFTDWREYHHRVLSMVNGKLVNFPINLDTLKDLTGEDINNEHDAIAYFAKVKVKKEEIKNAEDAVVSQVGFDLYKAFYRDYTIKMWGVHPSKLSPQVTKRIPVRFDHEDRYFTDKYQSIPLHGYRAMVATMLDHKNIEVELDTPFIDVPNMRGNYEHVCWTGPIDEYFNYRIGKLPYRSLDFFHVTEPASIGPYQATINYPGPEPFTRVTDMKAITGQYRPFTVKTIEFPKEDGDPYYPIPSPLYEEVARGYRLLAHDPTVKRNTLFIGRLGTYQYYNMDQVVAQAIHAAKLRL